MGKQIEEGKSGVVNLGFYVATCSDITEQEKHLTCRGKSTDPCFNFSFISYWLWSRTSPHTNTQMHNHVTLNS